MSTRRSNRRVRRVTVALRGYAAEARLLSSAARLARETASELAGVFLEDIELLHLAELPLAFEICRTTSARRPVQASELTRQLAAQAAACERALARVAGEAGVTWSFRVARGAVAALLESAAEEADITLFAAARQVVGVRGGTAMAPWPRGAERAPVGVVFEGSGASVRALEVAAHVAGTEKWPLTVILVSPAEEAGEALRARAHRALGKQPARFETLASPAPSRLLDMARAQGHAMLVLPAVPSVLAKDTVRALEEGLDCPILLVR